jgi:hypothetical protein
MGAQHLHRNISLEPERRLNQPSHRCVSRSHRLDRELGNLGIERFQFLEQRRLTIANLYHGRRDCALSGRPARQATQIRFFVFWSGHGWS